MKLADKIRILRKARNMSQEELGFSLSKVNKDGISRQTVSDWENGKFEPKLNNVRDLAEVLNVSYDALLDESLDLEDDKVLYAVLNNVNIKTEENIESSFTYRLYAYEFSRYSLVGIIMLILLLIASIVFVSILIKEIINKSSGSLFIVSLCIGPMCLVGAIVLLINVRDLVGGLFHGKFVPSFGSLTNDFLRISSYQSVQNTIYVPVKKIQSIELGKKANKYHGEVSINIKDRNKPLVLKDIKNPKKLIEVFNSLDSYIENPDEIKVL